MSCHITGFTSRPIILWADVVSPEATLVESFAKSWELEEKAAGWRRWSCETVRLTMHLRKCPDVFYRSKTRTLVLALLGLCH
jgi:hypothetical protein